MFGGGVSEHMENSICLTVFIFESFPKSSWNSVKRIFDTYVTKFNFKRTLNPFLKRHRQLSDVDRNVSSNLPLFLITRHFLGPPHPGYHLEQISP